MKRFSRKVLLVLASVGAAVTAFLVEGVVSVAIRGATDRAGLVGEIALSFAVGLSLLVGGPIWMTRENTARAAAGRKRKYGRLEIGIVTCGGAAFTAFGIVLLLRG